MEKIEERYNELITLIEKYNYNYYNLNQPLVDDAAYDELMRELIEIEERNPELKRLDSPSSMVGGVRSKTFDEVKHDPPMLSLGNVYNEEELFEFEKRCKKNFEQIVEPQFSAELKFDGLAVEVVYLEGRFYQGSTRGNGQAGEDISKNIATIRSLPSKLEGEVVPSYLSIRGEVFMRHSAFEQLNKSREETGEAQFANPRNAASGSLRQLDPEVTASRDLDIIIYGIGRVEGIDKIKNHYDMYIFLKKFNIPVSEHVKFGSIEEIIDYYQYWTGNRYKLDYDIDGIVIKLNDFRQREMMGNTSKAPRWAAAWKFPAKEAITRIDSVDYQIGRTGLITPVANLRPINIGGVIVKRATLHNFEEVKRLNVFIGDNVKVKRAGDVIPKITAVIQDERPGDAKSIVPPEDCPFCGTALNKEDIYLRCINPKCEEKKLENLKFFISKDAMDIEFFGPELVTRLYSSGKIKSMEDIFKLSSDDLLGVERMGEKIADKIISSIEKRKSIPLSHFLKSLGIRNIGEHISRVIAKNLKTVDALQKVGIEELMDINEVGPGVAESFYEYFHNDIDIISRFAEAGVVINDEPSAEISSAEINGKTFVFTGTLNSISRKEAEAMVEELNGRAAGSVSSKTDYLVSGANAGSKLKKAEALGVKIISEEEFLKMAGRQ